MAVRILDKEAESLMEIMTAEELAALVVYERSRRFWIKIFWASALPFAMAMTGVLVATYQTHRANMERDEARRELQSCQGKQP